MFQMNSWEVLSLFENIHVRHVNGKPILYKPALILYLLEQCFLENERLMTFENIERKLTEIFNGCFPNETHKNFHYAFGRLESDGILEIVNSPNLRRTASSDLYKSELLKNNVTGGFKQGIFDCLKSDYFLIREVGDYIIHQYIDDSIHDVILKKIKYK